MSFEQYITPPIPVAMQDRLVKSKYPQFKTKILQGNVATWVGEIKPTDSSQTYLVEITMQTSKPPAIVILNPKLEIAKGRTRLPHVFPGNRLCLHYPNYKQWENTKSVADTIIPWTSLWLFYYELWLIDGKWHGGGKEPNKRRANAG